MGAPNDYTDWYVQYQWIHRYVDDEDGKSEALSIAPEAKDEQEVDEGEAEGEGEGAREGAREGKD